MVTKAAGSRVKGNFESWVVNPFPLILVRIRERLGITKRGRLARTPAANGPFHRSRIRHRRNHTQKGWDLRYKIYVSDHSHSEAEVLQ